MRNFSVRRMTQEFQYWEAKGLQKYKWRRLSVAFLKIGRQQEQQVLPLTIAMPNMAKQKQRTQLFWVEEERCVGDRGQRRVLM